MSVQTEIDRIITAVQAAHEKVVEKGGTTTQPYLVGNLASAIDTIPDATEPVLQTKTVTPTTAKQIIKPDSGYDGLSQVDVNAMPTATQATPSITVSSGGLITATATQGAGYVASGTKSATKQLTVQAAQTITPGTSNKTIASGRYLTGTQTIKGDSNLVAGNIKSGVSIFGVAGSYEGSGGGGSATPEILPITVTDNGMYDPGTNEYVLSNDNLHSSSRSIIIITQSEKPYNLLVFFRENLSNSFIVKRGFSEGNEILSLHGIIVNENSIRAIGTLGGTGYNFVVI